MRSALIFVGLGLILAVVLAGVRENETILARGRIVRLQLAPLDPRSLMQGDYMALNYEVQNQLRGRRPHEDAYVVLREDADGIARFVRVQAAALPCAADEVALRFRVRGAGLGADPRRGAIRFATNAWFFAEGQGKVYEGARFGEFRVGDTGEPRLVAMLDAQRRRLGP